MTKTIRLLSVLAIAASLASAACLAESAGQATYKAHCQGCHGADGMANTGAGKVFQVKPTTDPEIRQMSEATMFTVVRNGSGRMQSWKSDLSDSQIKAVVSYFRTLIK